MSVYEYAAQWIDSAVSLADSIVVWPEPAPGAPSSKTDWRYDSIREYLNAAHEILLPIEGDAIREPRSRIEWALVNLPELPDACVVGSNSPSGITTINPRCRDPRMELFEPSPVKRAKWLIDTQADRLLMSGALLRDFARSANEEPPELKELTAKSHRFLLKVMEREGLTKETEARGAQGLYDAVGFKRKGGGLNYSKETVDKARDRLIHLKLVAKRGTTGPSAAYYVTPRGVVIASRIPEPSWGYY